MTKHDRYASDNFKKPRKHGNVKPTRSLRFCRKHAKVEPVESRCFREKKSPKSAAVHTYAPWVNTIIDDVPIRIESKAQHRRECAKRHLLCPE